MRSAGLSLHFDSYSSSIKYYFCRVKCRFPPIPAFLALFKSFVVTDKAEDVSTPLMINCYSNVAPFRDNRIPCSCPFLATLSPLSFEWQLSFQVSSMQLLHTFPRTGHIASISFVFYWTKGDECWVASEVKYISWLDVRTLSCRKRKNRTVFL
jgi:hypothetical protein